MMSTYNGYHEPQAQAQLRINQTIEAYTSNPLPKPQIGGTHRTGSNLKKKTSINVGGLNNTL
jgi:hypothetical protein